MAEETRTLLVTKSNGEEFQIDIPKTYKVTFGPAFVAKSDEIAGKKVPMALRVYETDKIQLAIFTDIAGFRDMDIPIRVKQVKTETKHGFVECDGQRKQTTFTATASEWINPDNPDEKPKLLARPTDIEIFGEDNG